MEATKKISVEIPVEDWERLLRLAKENERPASYYVRQAIKAILKRK